MQEVKYKSQQPLKCRELSVAEISGSDVRNGCITLCFPRILLRNKNGCDVQSVACCSHQTVMVRTARCSHGLEWL